MLFKLNSQARILPIPVFKGRERKPGYFVVSDSDNIFDLEATSEAIRNAFPLILFSERTLKAFLLKLVTRYYVYGNSRGGAYENKDSQPSGNVS